MSLLRQLRRLDNVATKVVRHTAAVPKFHGQRFAGRPTLAAQLPGGLVQRSFQTTTRCLSASNTREAVADNKLIEAGVRVSGKVYGRDAHTNVSNAILSKVGSELHRKPAHPLGIMAGLIRGYFGDAYDYYDALSPVVTPDSNFGSLCFPADHPGRSRSDSYYLSRDWMLRTHTSAHQVELMKRGSRRFLLAADVYRRDEIDRTHYPVFHQIEGVHVFPQGQVDAPPHAVTAEGPPNATDNNPRQLCYQLPDTKACEVHLKASLEGMVREIFAAAASTLGDRNGPIKMRWVEAYFPFTSPSYELEVWYDNQWMEILGCGVIQHKILENAGLPNSIGWAFGIGLDRLAMALFKIPDIRLFWSNDARFIGQFAAGRVSHFSPFSPYPACTKDISFWLPPRQDTEKDQSVDNFHPNDLFELVRDVAGDLVEDVKQVDQFTHPKTGRESHCYRILYRSMDRNVTNEEINVMQEQVRRLAPQRLGVELR